MRRLALLLATVLALMLPAGAALAHDELHLTPWQQFVVYVIPLAVLALSLLGLFTLIYWAARGARYLYRRFRPTTNRTEEVT